MATFAQIVIARAGETQGVWALSPAFTGGGKAKGEHMSQISSVAFARGEKDTAVGLLFTAASSVTVEHEFFASMNVSIAARLDSEVADTDPLQVRVDQADNIAPKSEADIERRTELTFVIWKEVNTARAAEVPPRPALTIRNTTQAQYETRYGQLGPKKITRDERDGTVTAKRTLEKREARKLDLWNKNWFQAWKSEFLAGTEQGDALVNVHTEESTPVPGILDITGVAQTGFSVKVDFDAESGEHASVLELLFKIVGIHTDYQRVPANKVNGNTIGPFLQNQVLKIRTDVGNSRDFSELGPEQTVTIGPSV